MRNFLFLSAMEPLASQVADELSENAEQTKSTIEKFFDHFSLPKLVSAAILLVICIICIKIILRAAEKMLKSSKLDKSCHAFIRSSIIFCSRACAQPVWHRRPYSLEKTIAPTSISPHLCCR